MIWLATIVYTYLDARRRIEDPFLVGCATVAAFFPFIGTAVYAILRPPELISDARERELDIRTAELRLRHLTEQSCPNCNFPIDKNFLRCPACERHLKDPCASCSRPVDPRWSICPYCEAELPGRSRRARGTSRSRDSEASQAQGEEKRETGKLEAAGGQKGAQRSGASSKRDGGESRGRSRTSSKQGGTGGSGSKSSGKGKSGGTKSGGGSSSSPASKGQGGRNAPARRDV